MLYKKILRDIRDYKIQFISVFLMAFLGLFILSGAIGEANSLEENINQYYQDTNLAEGWIYASNIDGDFVKKVNDLNPTTATERQFVVNSQANLSSDPEIKLHFIESNTISKFYLAEGEPLDINDENGVWLDKSFADARNLTVGDNITFEVNGMEIEKEIKGIGYSPEYVYNVPYHEIKPNYTQYGFAYLSYKAFPMDDVPYNVLNVKFNGTAENYSNLLSNNLNGDYNSFVQQEDHSSVSMYQTMITNFKMIASILPLVFMFISMLILLTSMKRVITHQRTQIGILKANGFKNRTIMIHYISYGFIIVLLGSVLGLITGPVIIHKIAFPPLENIFKLPYFNTVGSLNFFFVVIIMVLLSILVSYFSVRTIVNEDPSTIIRPKAPKATTSSFVEKFPFWNNLSFNFRWNYRDAKRHNFRAIMTICGVLGCTVILIAAIGMYDGMTDVEQWEFEKINHFESKLIIDNNATSSQINDVADSVNGEEIMESAIEIESNLCKKTATLTVLNDTDLITPTDINQNPIEIKDDEVAISQKMADLLGVSVGDTVKFHFMDSDQWVEVKIDKIHGHPSSQGFIMSPEKLEELGLNYTPTSIITSENVDDDYDGIKSVIHLEDLKDSSKELKKSLWTMIYALMIFAILLALIVLYNLNLLSFLEMERDIGTLKVLGFTSRDLTKLLLTQSLLFIIIGFIAGIPIGYQVLVLIWESSSDKFYTIPTITFLNLLGTFIIMLLVSIAININFSYKIKKLDMVEALKILE